MYKIREAIVVEGRYDKNALSQVIDAPIFETKGFGVMKDKELLRFLREVAVRRGLIILTDSDGAGFVIRNFLKGRIQSGRVLHAYIPDVEGKEKRKLQPGKEGKLGVEGMKPEVLLNAILSCGATVEGEAFEAKPRQPITKKDLYDLQLTGWPDSEARRDELKRVLQLPKHLSTNGLLDALNVMFERDEFLGIEEENDD
jgi:ribonuclease M5